MFDLDHAEFEFPCPECQFVNSATLRQVRLGDRVICRGCKKPVRLVDKDTSVHNASRRLDEDLAALKNALNLEIKP
jgi:hypothetical protein